MFKLEECIAYLASRETKVLSAALEERLAVLGITRVQWMTLYYIAGNPDITQIELAEKMGSKGSTIARLLDRMEKDHLVLRDRKDRRTNRIELTEKGQNYYEKGMVIAERFKDDALKDIPEEYLEHFSMVLEKMVENTR